MSTTTNPASRQQSSAAAYDIAVRVAAVAGVFSLLVFAMLLVGYAHRLAKDPLDSDEFRALKAELLKRPRDEDLKQQIRDLDLKLRNAYFHQRRFTEVGSYLLLGGVLVWLAATRWAVVLRRRLPQPQPCACPQDHESRTNAIARWGVTGLAAAMVGVAAAMVAGFSTGLPRDAEQWRAMYGSQEGESPVFAARKSGQTPAAEESGKPPTAAAAPADATAYPSDEEVAKNWPRFRGPDGSGIARYTNIPTSWDVASGKGIVWRTPVPLGGHSSPIVWGDRIFLCGADKDRREVYSFETASGKLLWRKPVPGPARPPSRPLELDEETNSGWAAPTPTTDGRRAFAIFPVGELVALDFAGNQVWKRSFGVPVNAYGHSASLVMYRNLLIVQLDQGSSGEGLSRLYGLDAATGKTAWEVKRDVPNSWSTPIVVTTGGRPQLITTADPWAIAYAPEDGSEIWRAKCLRQDVGPSAVVAGDVVYTSGQAPQTTAIRADGKGDVTSSKILWIAEDELPDTCSPLATEKYVILLTSEGMMTCYDAKQGKKLWEQEFDASFKTSPSLVGDRVYVFSDKGKCWIVEPGPTACKAIAEASLGEGCTSCPAFQDGRMYVRGAKHLYCIGSK